MDYRLLGQTGVEVSCVGLGCGGFGGIGSEVALFGKGESESEAFALMDRALELGMNYFDTADSYGGGRSEEIVGRWLRSRGARDDVVLSTKVFNRMRADRNSGGLNRRHVIREVEESLRRLQTDRIDIYLAHGVDPQAAPEEAVRTFDDLVRAGKVCYVGACNIEAWRVMKSLAISERLGAARLECVQNEYNLLRRGVEAEMLSLVMEERLAFVAYSPLSGGWLTSKYREDQPPPPGSRMTLRPGPYEELKRPETYRALDALAEAANEFGSSMAALALAWVSSHSAVTSALVGPRNLEQFKSVIEAIELRLSEGDRRKLVSQLTASGQPFPT